MKTKQQRKARVSFSTRSMAEAVKRAEAFVANAGGVYCKGKRDHQHQWQIAASSERGVKVDTDCPMFNNALFAVRGH